MKTPAPWIPGLLWVISVAAAFSCVPAGAASADGEWEQFDDGSAGRVTEFQGEDGVTIPAYLRKPKGTGPFPVIVMLHGGGYGKGATYGLGRSTPVTAEFIKAGWAIYSIDYRPTKIMLDPIEIEDSVLAVKTVCKLPFIDSKRVGLIGGSHGGNVTSRLLSRVDARGAILCAPAALDLIEIKKAAGRGEKFVGILNKLVAQMEQRHGATAEEIEKDPAKYGYRSALTEAAQARCPILIINGRNDAASPVSVIDVYVKRLRAASKQAETYLPDNGPHGFYWSRPDIPESKEAARRAVAFFQRRFANQAAAEPPVWLDPNRSEPSGTHYRTFKSKLVGGEVSYLVYLPADYESHTERRYPVVYWLHGYGGNQRAGAVFVKPLDAMIRAGKAPPMIVILVNGIKASFYRDEPSGKRPVESMIIKELIPHVDQTFRTLARREARAVEGFSMGGFGAGHLGFKFPEVFGVVGVMAGAMGNWAGADSRPPPTQDPAKLSPERKAFLEANHPYTLVKKNADALRGKSVIRIVVGDQDSLLPYNRALHELLTTLKIEHEYEVIPGVGHDSRAVYDKLGERGFAMYLKAWSAKRP